MSNTLSAICQSADRSLTFPELEPCTGEEASDLAAVIEYVYQFCKNNAQAPEGGLYITYDYDFSQKNIHIRTATDLPKKKVTRLSTSSYIHQESKQCVAREWVFDFDGKTEKYYTPRMALFPPVKYFTGMELEIRSPHGENLAGPRPEVVWDHWDSHDTEINNDVNTYITKIHPKIVECVEKIGQISPQKRLTILDIGGGRGRLAEKILEKLPEKVKEMVILDKSTSAYKAARQVVRKFPEQLKVKQMDVVEEKLTQEADVVILSGVLQHTVLSLSNAQAVLINCHSILRNGGYLIIASRADAIFTAYSFEQLNLKVLNKTLSYPSTEKPERSFRTHSFYVLQKTG